MTTHEHEPEESYDGPAELAGIPVRVALRGHFEPIDGRFHWYGRVATSPEVDQAHDSGSTLELITPHGSATGRIADRDFWGRYRITGTGRPPF